MPAAYLTATVCGAVSSWQNPYAFAGPVSAEGGKTPFCHLRQKNWENVGGSREQGGKIDSRGRQPTYHPLRGRGGQSPKPFSRVNRVTSLKKVIGKGNADKGVEGNTAIFGARFGTRVQTWGKTSSYSKLLCYFLSERVFDPGLCCRSVLFSCHDWSPLVSFWSIDVKRGSK